jgi:hypothetical protein
VTHLARDLLEDRVGCDAGAGDHPGDSNIVVVDVPLALWHPELAEPVAVVAREDDCPDRNPPFLAVKRAARPYKTGIENRFTMENAKGA